MMASDPRFLSGLPVLCRRHRVQKSFVRAGEALGLDPIRGQPGNSTTGRAVKHSGFLSGTLKNRAPDRRWKGILAKKPCLFWPSWKTWRKERKNISGIARGQLRINVDPTFARLFLAPRLGTFLKAQPALRLELMASDRLGDMVADGFDVAIRFGEPEPSCIDRSSVVAHSGP